MDELEYITAEALIMCDQGAAPDYFKPTHNTTIKVHDCLVATEKDGAPLTNIPSFKICKKTQKPCRPMTAPDTWEDTWDVKVKGAKSLIGKSTCPCNMGGTIEFMTSGQIPLPDDAAAEVEALQNQAQRELDDSGYGDSVGETGFAEGMIPVWGSGRDLVNDIQTGDVLGGVMNAGFLVWDVVSIGVGIFTFGGGTALMQAGKAAVKGTAKAATKLVSKKALQQLGKAAFKKLSKDALKKSVDDVAKKLLKTCVFACFPAGTPVHTEFGLKNIEEIQVGDKVWAYDEETGETGLQEVIDTVERESDHTIAIYTETEVIETTAQHPFFISGQWKDAAELQAGDKILIKGQREVAVKDTKFKYEPKKVYNFEVANWHTYFVGVLAWLVHNAGKCLSKKAILDALKNTSRLDHAARHLIDEGIILANSGSKAAREAMSNIAKDVLTNPTKTFDHVMKRGGQSVEGFYKKVNGEDIVVFIAKEPKGKIAIGDIVTSIKPTPQQMINYGL